MQYPEQRPQVSVGEKINEYWAKVTLTCRYVLAIAARFFLIGCVSIYILSWFFNRLPYTCVDIPYYVVYRFESMAFSMILFSLAVVDGAVRLLVLAGSKGIFERVANNQPVDLPGPCNSS